MPSTSPGLIAQGNGEPSEPGMGEMLGRLHLMMRGKYLISSVLAVLMAGGLGYAGYKLGTQSYRSVGQLRVVPTLPKVIYDTGDQGVMPMFDSFVQTQVSLMRTQRVIESALEDRVWPTPPPHDDASVAEFIKNLNVIRDNEIIAVTYDSSDPVFAQRAVKSVISSYKKLYMEQDSTENNTVLNLLTKSQALLNADLKANRDRIHDLAMVYNTDQLNGAFTAAQEQEATLQKRLDELKDQQAKLEAFTNSPDMMNVEDLAMSDDELRDLMRQRKLAQAKLNRLIQETAPANPSVKAARGDLQEVQQLIDDRIAELKARAGDGSMSAAGSRLAKQIDEVSSALAVASQRVKSVGQDQLLIADLKREGAEIEEKLNAVKTRLDALTTEAPMSTGRITVISDGDRPLAAFKDTRKTFGGAAGVFGFLFPFGVALLIGSTNRKYGTPVETRMSTITRDLVLGALPSVDEGQFDPEASTVAAHCLHQVRTMLQIRCNGNAKAIAITSARSGSGKTSVVLGLGVSYAIAGSRTLLIDLDLVGGGLTRRAEVQARARLGNLLIQQGLVTDEQLQKALALAKEKQIKLGEAFLEAGFLTREQLDGILNEQKRSHAGLMDALYGKSLAECVSSAGMPDLDILPLGSANPHDAATLSPSELKSVIEEAKEQYDTVLIDTGPVPGSLEASMVASVTDGVLLVVSRGEPRANAEASIEHLRRIGGRVLGLVFNRAKPSEAGIVGGSMYQGSTSLRLSTPPPSTDRSKSTAVRQAQTARFGPVGQAVLDLAPSDLS